MRTIVFIMLSLLYREDITAQMVSTSVPKSNVKNEKELINKIFYLVEIDKNNEKYLPHYCIQGIPKIFIIGEYLIDNSSEIGNTLKILKIESKKNKIIVYTHLQGYDKNKGEIFEFEKLDSQGKFYKKGKDIYIEGNYVNTLPIINKDKRPCSSIDN